MTFCWFRKKALDLRLPMFYTVTTWYGEWPFLDYFPSLLACSVQIIEGASALCFAALKEHQESLKGCTPCVM